MATPTDSAFKFSDDGDHVPGTGPHLNAAQIQEIGKDNSRHSYAHGTQDEGVLMPQPKIRQTALLNEQNPDGGYTLGYEYDGCQAPVTFCTDDFRYWPAYRQDANVTTSINKFVINTTSEVGCGRWASKNKVSSGNFS